MSVFTDLQIRALRKLAGASCAMRGVSLAAALGVENRGSIYRVVSDLRLKGLVTVTRSDKGGIAITEAGREALRNAVVDDRILSGPKPFTMLHRDDPGIAGYQRRPDKGLPESAIAALYAGARYENKRGKEFMDNMRVSRALQSIPGQGSSNDGISTMGAAPRIR